jgi:hypothetical protein
MVAPLDGTGRLGPADELSPAEGGEPTHLAWRRDGALLYAAVARGASIEIEALAAADGADGHRVTRGAGASFAPAPSPDGRTLFYLSLSPDGLDVRRLKLDAATVQTDDGAGQAPPPTAPGGFAEGPVSSPRPYGAGRAELRALAGGTASSDESAFELGARVGDLLGRWELLALSGTASDDARGGGALRAALQISPVELGLDLARIRLGQRDVDSLAVAAGGSTAFAGGGLRWRGALGWSRDPAHRLDDTVAQLGVAGEIARRHGRATLSLLGEADRSAATTGDGHLDRLRLGGRLERGGDALALVATSWRAGDGATPRFLPSLGGVPSSLAPPTLEPGRIDLPALPAGALVASRLDRLELRAALAPVPLALVASRWIARRDAGPDAELRLIGLERVWRLDALPLVGLPALEARVGVARLAGDAGEHGSRWWIGLGFPLPR